MADFRDINDKEFQRQKIRNMIDGRTYHPAKVGVISNVCDRLFCQSRDKFIQGIELMAGIVDGDLGQVFEGDILERKKKLAEC